MQRNGARRLLWSCAVLLPLVAGCERETETQIATDTLAAPATAPAAGTGTAAAGAGAATMPPELRSRSDQFTAGWNGSDPAALAALFTEDATAVVGDSTYRGRAQIQQRWLQPNVAMVSDLRPVEETVEQSGQDYVVSGPYTLRASPPQQGAQPIAERGRYRATWTRGPGGQWMIRAVEVRPEGQSPAI